MLGSLYKFPGLQYFTGYKFAEFVMSDSFLSMSQYKDMINEVLMRYPWIKDKYHRRFIEFPRCKDNIPKVALMIKLKPGSSIQERSLLKNNLLNFVNDESLTVFDAITFMEDIDARMGMLDFFNFSISLVCFILGFF